LYTSVAGQAEVPNTADDSRSVNMFENLRRCQVLRAVAVCGGLSLAAISFCVGIAGANSAQPAPADDPFLPWVGDPGLFTPAPDTGTLLTNAGNVTPLVTDAGSMLQGPSDPGTLFSDTGTILDDLGSMMSAPPAPDAVPADPDAVPPDPNAGAPDPDVPPISDT
jgi:hypothetical protein